MFHGDGCENLTLDTSGEGYHNAEHNTIILCWNYYNTQDERIGNKNCGMLEINWIDVFDTKTKCWNVEMFVLESWFAEKLSYFFPFSGNDFFKIRIQIQKLFYFYFEKSSYSELYRKFIFILLKDWIETEKKHWISHSKIKI